MNQDHDAIRDRLRATWMRLDNPSDPLAGLKHFTAAELGRRDIPAPEYLIEGVLPEGLSLLAAKPKIGKTLLALNVAVAIATGGLALGKVPVKQGHVLYLYLEGSDAGLKNRLESLCGEGNLPDSLTLLRSFPRLDEGGAGIFKRYIEAHPTTRLIIVDTLKKVKARGNGRRMAYDEDYESLEPLATLTRDTGVSILVIHHTRKADAEDPMDLVSGSTGLTGAVDNVLVMTKERGQMDARLTVLPREEEEAELALVFDPLLSTWTLAGSAEDFAKTAEQQEIVNILRAASSAGEGGLQRKQIVERLSTAKSGPAVSKLVGKLKDAAMVVEVPGPGPARYTVPINDPGYGGYRGYSPSENGPTEPEEAIPAVTPEETLVTASALDDTVLEGTVTPSAQGVTVSEPEMAPSIPYEDDVTAVTPVTTFSNTLEVAATECLFQKGDWVETEHGCGMISGVGRLHVVVKAGDKVHYLKPSEVTLAAPPFHNAGGSAPAAS